MSTPEQDCNCEQALDAEKRIGGHEVALRSIVKILKSYAFHHSDCPEICAALIVAKEALREEYENQTTESPAPSSS